MAQKRKWDEKDLARVVASSPSYRQVLLTLGLVEAGGNYEQIKKHIILHNLDITHFTGKMWSKGKKVIRKPNIATSLILVENSYFQSYKLKKRLFKEGLKNKKCELCGWAQQAVDGRLPLELDHINGNRNDNRLENLRILCPNCHSLQPTHRGRNIKRPGGETGRHARLKIS